MSLFAMYQELKSTEEYLLTQREYAAIVKTAAKKVIKEYIQLRNQARADLKAWCDANPEPKRPVDYASGAEFERWRDKYQSHRNAWGHEYQKLYHLGVSVSQLKKNIILANVIESGRIDECRKNPSFWMYFGGVNNPLMNQGQAIFRALYQGKCVPQNVLDEWPEGVEQVRKQIAERAA